ncbi:TPA: hypothetical protein MI645_00005, partial [Klebsiella pneumoniae]|nr:hypothetical protein [Klebsiella pneumoniae]
MDSHFFSQARFSRSSPAQGQGKSGLWRRDCHDGVLFCVERRYRRDFPGGGAAHLVRPQGRSPVSD